MRIAPSRPLLSTLLLALFVANVAIVSVHAAKPADMSATPQESPQESKARAVFEEFVRLGEAFDLALVDLYADTAKISNRRVFPDGTSREMDMPAITRSLALRTPPIISPGHPELTMDTAHSLFPDQKNHVLERIKQREEAAIKGYRPGIDELLLVLVTLEQGRATRKTIVGSDPGWAATLGPLTVRLQKHQEWSQFFVTTQVYSSSTRKVRYPPHIDPTREEMERQDYVRVSEAYLAYDKDLRSRDGKQGRDL